MTYVITQPCIGVKDKGCIDVCPMDCIHGTDDDSTLYIDPCGCIPACPVNAIFPDNEVPEKWQEYTRINADYFTGKK